MSDEHRDLSRLSDAEIKRQFLALSNEQGKRLERQMEYAQALIDALLKAYPQYTETDILRLVLRRRQAMEAREQHLDNSQVNVGDIRVTGHIHIVKESEEEENADVE